MGRAGSSWRVLAHVPGGESLSVETAPRAEGAGLLRVVDASGTVFDELVVDDWIHLEQLSSTLWHLRLGGVSADIEVSRDGKPVGINVYGPGDFVEPVEGCEYRLMWSGGVG